LKNQTKEKKEQFTVVVSFSKKFRDEYAFINELDKENINRSGWICEAIREKRLNTERDEKRIEMLENQMDLIKDLQEEIIKLRKEVKERPVYVVNNSNNDTEDRGNDKVDYSDVLKKNAAMFPL
jgi:hypothetical protein